MKKKSFWRRANRGFLVSMVLIVAVVLYVAITQFMLIPQRAEIQRLGDSLGKLWESTLLSDERLAELKASETKQKEMQDALREELSALFVPNSDYLDSATESLFAYARGEIEGYQRVVKRTYHKTSMEACNILEDTATVRMNLYYAVDGSFLVYENDESVLKSMEGISQTLYLNFVCKRVDGDWKIYRLSSLSEYTGIDDGRY